MAQSESETDAKPETEYATPASKTVKRLREGHVIEVPQYANALEVTKASALNGEENAYIGLTFVDRSTSAEKTLIVNENSGRVYLTAGTADKGEVREIEIVGSPSGDSAALAAELESREDVRRATDAWDTCDVAAVVEPHCEIGLLRDAYDVVDVNDFDAADHLLVTLDA